MRRSSSSAARSLLTAAVAFASLAALAVTPAAAAPQTESIPLATAGPAPTSGTLDNQVGWSVNVGTWDAATGQGYAFSVDAKQETQVFSFDHPVSVRFGVAGLNVGGECIRVPEGTVAETINPNHAWDPATRLVCQTAASAASDVSTFTVADPAFQLELEGVGAPGGPVRGPTFIELTYDLPEASIAVPVQGASYPMGSTVAADFACAAGGGQIIASNASAPLGAPIDTNTPGPHEFTVTCTDEYGSTDTATVTYNVTAPTLTGRAYALSVGGLLSVLRIPDTGPVATQTASTTANPCVATLKVGVALTAHNLCASVTTTLEPPTSTATASVSDTALNLLGLPAISIGPASVTVKAGCDPTRENTSGSATVGFVRIGNLLIHSSPLAAQPNTTYNVGLLKVVLNEQIFTSGPGQGLTVNAVHITSPAGGSLLDLFVASATSGSWSTCPT